MMRNSRNGVIPLDAQGRQAYYPDNDRLGPRNGPFNVEVSKRIVDEEKYYDDLYSRNLTQLVNKCLQEDLRHRPGLQELYDAVLAGRIAFDKQNGNLGDEIVNQVPEWFRVDYLEEEFKLGDRFSGRKQRNVYGRGNTEGPDPYSDGERDAFEHWLEQGQGEDDDDDDDDDYMAWWLADEDADDDGDDEDV
jgi:hypothetical protein